MINITHILPNVFSAKRVLRYAKTVLASNMVFAIAALPMGSLPVVYQNEPQASLIIPTDKLETAFNINDAASQGPKIQVPLVYTYMSQGYSIFHPGIDLAAKYATPVKPIESGTVEEAGFSPYGYGKMVLINHGDGTESLYAHLSEIEVKKGDRVDINTEIGLVGVTGRSTGPHLHLEVHKNGKSINPLSILPPSRGTGLLTLAR